MAKAALLVASSDYHDQKFQQLRAPARDVDALAHVLGDPAIGGFDVRTLLNEPSWQVSEEIEAFFADRKPDDLLLLYFSCHGIKDASGKLYFASKNTKFPLLAATGISSGWVNDRMDSSRSRRVVLLLDCCYSGAFARGLAPKGTAGVDVEEFGGRGRAVIAASKAMEYAYEGDTLTMDVGQPSVFTRALVHGLETGEADRDGDGRVGVNELYDYVYDRVRKTTPSQTPTMSAHGLEGELYLARNPRPPPPPVEPVPLPFELRQAVESEIAWQRAGAVTGLKRLLTSDHPGLVLTAREALKGLAEDNDADVRAIAAVALGAAAPAEPSTASLEAQRTRAGARVGGLSLGKIWPRTPVGQDLAAYPAGASAQRPARRIHGGRIHGGRRRPA
ncbi:MAG: caspase family protein [Egibacteraceae bacterium]